jgi:hypothetical protein
MAVGLSQTNFIHRILNHIKGSGSTTFTSPAQLYVRLHTADPGAAGTTATSTGGGATGVAVNFAAAAANAIALTGTQPSWASLTATETISHISVWDAVSAGNFLWSAALTASKSVVAGDTLTLTTCTLTLSPQAT